MTTSLPDLAICWSGEFSSLQIADHSLSECSPIDLQEDEKSELYSRFFRVVAVPWDDDAFVAVSGSSPPFGVVCCDLENRHIVSRALGHRRSIRGIAGIGPSGIFSTPRIVSGGSGDKQILIFDACTGTKLSSLPNPPFYCLRMLHVSEWNHHDVFVGGGADVPGGYFLRYDLELNQQTCSYDVPVGNIWGIAAGVSRKLLLTVTDSAKARIWSRGAKTCLQEISLDRDGFSCFWCEEKNCFLVGTTDGSVEVWDARKTDARLRKSKIVQETVNDMDQVEENLFVFGSRDREISVWDLESNLVVERLRVSGVVEGVHVLQRDVCGDDEVCDAKLVFLTELLEERMTVLRSHSTQAIQLFLCLLVQVG